MGATHESNSDSSCGYHRNSAECTPYAHYVLIPGSPRRRRSRSSCCSCSICLPCKFMVAVLVLISLAAAGFVLFPRHPDIEVKQITLEKINLHLVDGESVPAVQLDVSLSLRVKITNPNYFGVVYDKVSVLISYKGDDLGKVESKGGDIPSRSTVMATARLDLLGVQLLEHAADLVEDVAKREIELETVTVFSGGVKMFALRPQIKVTVYCSIWVDPVDKEVLRRDCSLLRLK